jgi:predicted nucleic acid-binding protein
MIAVDTTVLIDYFQGANNAKTDKLDEAFTYHSLVLPPVVITEIMSDSLLPREFSEKILELPILEPTQGYWQRAGNSRAKLIVKKLKARLADALIAQSCVDYKVPLLTQDSDFRHFAKFCGLILLDH